MKTGPPRSAVRAGFRALSHGKLIALLTVSTVLLAVMAAAPLAPALWRSFSGTLAGDNVLRNHPTFAPTDVLDFLRERKDAVAATRRSALCAALIGMGLQFFFAGGFITVLGKSGPFSWGDFFAGAQRNLWHNAKCFLLFAAAGGLTVGAWLVSALAATEKLFEKSPPGAIETFIARVGVLVVALFLFAAFSLLYDFARATRRHAPDAGAARAYGSAIDLLRGCWPRAFGIFFFWFAFGGTVWLTLMAVEWVIPAVAGLAIFLHALMQIGILAVRSAVRVATWGSCLALFDERVERISPREPFRHFRPPVPADSIDTLPSTLNPS